MKKFLIIFLIVVSLWLLFFALPRYQSYSRVQDDCRNHQQFVDDEQQMSINQILNENLKGFGVDVVVDSLNKFKAICHEVQKVGVVSVVLFNPVLEVQYESSLPEPDKVFERCLEIEEAKQKKGNVPALGEMKEKYCKSISEIIDEFRQQPPARKVTDWSEMIRLYKEKNIIF